MVKEKNIDDWKDRYMKLAKVHNAALANLKMQCLTYRHTVKTIG